MATSKVTTTHTLELTKAEYHLLRFIVIGVSNINEPEFNSMCSFTDDTSRTYEEFSQEVDKLIDGNVDDDSGDVTEAGIFS